MVPEGLTGEDRRSTLIQTEWNVNLQEQRREGVDTANNNAEKPGFLLPLP